MLPEFDSKVLESLHYRFYQDIMSIPKLCSGVLSDQQTQTLYSWIDTISLSRPKRNIGRDFSDGVLLAEVVASVHPAIVELHNYTSASSFTQKMYNWDTLNFKVFKKLGLQFHQQDLEDCCNVCSRIIHSFLYFSSFRVRLRKFCIAFINS